MVALTSLGATPAVRAAGCPSGAHDAEALAKQLSNPVSSLVSVPFQFNWEQNVGPAEQDEVRAERAAGDAVRADRELEPDHALVVPFVGQPPLAEGGTPASGIADTAGVVLLLTSEERPHVGGRARDSACHPRRRPTLGTEKWSAGPTVVVVKQHGHWTFGALWNQVWSFSGNDRVST
jgi:hypothetical protein